MLQQMMLFAMALAVLATGLVAGVFLAFSDFVMRALSAAGPVAGMEAMQQINRKVYRSVFMWLLMGMVPAGFALAASGLGLSGGPAAAWMLIGALVYTGGVVAVTGLGNVPMNQRLDVLDRQRADAQAYWRRYARDWTRLNHLRSLASALASLCYLCAMMSLAQGT